MDKNVPKRIVIYAKDIVNILGKKKSAAQVMMQNMRRQLGKKREEFITVEEFCQFTGIKEEKVYAMIKN
ncbi:hypothetical protein [Chitinophaga defluvii]|uniref:Helix-turn-helix protein n=1 Tax=Chitinophaga defluvii TaxID=3163343 RepID=A0ABV2TAU5_9BACT